MVGHILPPCSPYNTYNTYDTYAHLATWRYKQSSLTGVLGSQIWGGNMKNCKNIYHKHNHKYYKKYCKKDKSPNMWKYSASSWKMCLQWIDEENQRQNWRILDFGLCHFEREYLPNMIDILWTYKSKEMMTHYNINPNLFPKFTSKLGSIFHFYSLIFHGSTW